MRRQDSKKIVLVGFLITTLWACAKTDNYVAPSGEFNADPGGTELEEPVVLYERAHYEAACVTEPPPPRKWWEKQILPADVPKIPKELPSWTTPITVNECPGLNNGEPHFYNRQMPGLVALVDCNSKIVRFKSRDFQINEASAISPTGTIDLRIMYFVRILEDAEGNKNCWTRLLGHITGTADCSGDPKTAKIQITTSWTFDETPPEIMEPPTPGMADLRNGKHCKLKPGNCVFTNTADLSCEGTTVTMIPEPVPTPTPTPRPTRTPTPVPAPTATP